MADSGAPRAMAAAAPRRSDATTHADQGMDEVDRPVRPDDRFPSERIRDRGRPLGGQPGEPGELSCGGGRPEDGQGPGEARCVGPKATDAGQDRTGDCLRTQTRDPVDLRRYRPDLLIGERVERLGEKERVSPRGHGARCAEGNVRVPAQTLSDQRAHRVRAQRGRVHADDLDPAEHAIDQLVRLRAGASGQQ